MFDGQDAVEADIVQSRQTPANRFRLSQAACTATSELQRNGGDRGPNMPFPLRPSDKISVSLGGYGKYDRQIQTKDDVIDAHPIQMGWVVVKPNSWE